MSGRDLFEPVRRARLQELCEGRGLRSPGGRWRTAEAAAFIGKPPRSTSNLLTGNGPFGAVVARELERHMNLPVGWLDGIGLEDEFVRVPRIDVSLAAGHGAANQTFEMVGFLAFNRDFLSSVGVRPESAKVVNVKGASMEPEIPDGAVLLLSTASTLPRSGCVYALNDHTGGLMVKRLVVTPSGWIARSTNPEFSDIGVTDHHSIIGRAVWMGSKI